MRQSIVATYGHVHLIEALVHYNRALDLREQDGRNVEVSELLFKSLNKLQTGAGAGEHTAEVAGFLRLVSTAVTEDVALRRFIGNELRAFAMLNQQVMDHSVLRGLRPGVELNRRIERDSKEKHQRLLTALSKFDHGDPEAAARVVKRTGELLYVVRSNIAHGEKTPYGPDLAKRHRDESVCEVVIPLQLLLLDLLLGGPAERLATYGTLSPGQPHHTNLQPLAGRWAPCTLSGSIAIEDGLPVFTWEPFGPETVPGHVLESMALANHWNELDRLEGIRYRRHLVTATIIMMDASSVRETAVVNLYVGRRESWRDTQRST